MDILSRVYGEFVNVSGTSTFIALVKRINSKVYLMNTTHEACPKFELDWLSLNNMNNKADIILQTVIFKQSRNTQIDLNLHVAADSKILEKYSYEVIQKPRLCVIYTRDPQNINYANPIFTDPFEFLIYSNSGSHNNYQTINHSEFSLEYLKGIVKERFETIEQPPYILLECGATLFNEILKTNDIPEYLLLTELEGDDRNDYLASELNISDVSDNYQIVHSSEVFTDNSGKWVINVYKKKEKN